MSDLHPHHHPDAICCGKVSPMVWDDDLGEWVYLCPCGHRRSQS